ncbi:MAG: ABC transporter ATP-binding protein [Anaerolineaceae bacterium]|nr:ABC transporter ATP-binding protein [Anaerolineaceae bacterium]
MEAPPVLEVCDLSVTFANENGGLRALKDVHFSVASQEFVCVLGPSGSGKSTLLRILAGLIEPTHGEVRFSLGCNDCPPRVAVVFQQANLMPWRTVLHNITLPLELQGEDHATAVARARQMVALIGLEGFEQEWPRNLSGGMAQRVALARALVQDPDILLLDEPCGARDARTPERLGAALRHRWQERRKTVIMVTHSISEALLLSDRVLVFTPRPGQVYLDLPVDLPRPRREDIRYTSHFGELAHRLRAAIQ